MTESLEQQLEKWRKVLLVYLGAALALLITALIDLPARISILQQNNGMMVDGWLGVWFILLIACLTPGILLLVIQRWRKAELEGRVTTGFSFLGVAWLVMLGFSFHVNVLLPAVGHFIIFALGLFLAVFFLVSRGKHRKEEIFP